MNLIDQISFLQQKPDTTTGRYVNGTGDFIEMLPTFEAENTNTLTAIDEDIFNNTNNFTLDQNHPNPFTKSTTIGFYLEEGSDVTLNIYNQQGAVIQTLASGYLSEGKHTFTWSTEGKSKGLYFYSLSAAGKTDVKKMIVQ